MREVGGHRQIEQSVPEPPYWSRPLLSNGRLSENHREFANKLVNDYLPRDPAERVSEQRIRCIIISHYICLGHTAEETCEYLREQGYSLSENALYQVAKKLNDRAEKICPEFGVHPPVKKDKSARFDRHQWERRFRKVQSRTPAVGRGRLMGTVDMAVDGDEEATETIALYRALSISMLWELGALHYIGPLPHSASRL